MTAMLMVSVVPSATEWLDELMGLAQGFRNDIFFARILSAQRSGATCLPAQLGLSASEFIAMTDRCFPGMPNSWIEWDDERSELRQQLLEMRRDEWLDVRNLLMHGRSSDSPDMLWMANIVAAACMGGGHLWRDLGMSSRAELRELLIYHFPLVAMHNTKDMKWKKFFYKQLCDQEGGYVCRSPSCEQCTSYDECFGPEN